MFNFRWAGGNVISISRFENCSSLRYHHTKIEYFDGSDLVTFQLISAKLSDLSQDFRPADILRVSQAIKGFDKSDFCEVFSIYRKVTVASSPVIK